VEVLSELLFVTTPNVAATHRKSSQGFNKAPRLRGHPATPRLQFPRFAPIKEPDLLRGLPWRAQADGKSFVQLQVFASSGLRLARSGHFSHSYALAAPAGVGLGQGVFVSKHSTAIQTRRTHPMRTNQFQHRHHERTQQQRHFQFPPLLENVILQLQSVLAKSRSQYGVPICL